MTLDYYLADIENYKTVCYKEDGYLKGEVEAIVFATLVMGLNEITAKTLPEWKARIQILDRVGLDWMGSVVNDKGIRESWYPDNKLLESLLGFRTNATKTTRFAFWKSVMKAVDEEIAYKVA